MAINPDARLLAHARAQGWQVRDFRTRRRQAVKVGVPVAALAGALAGAAFAAIVVNRRRR